MAGRSLNQSKRWPRAGLAFGIRGFTAVDLVAARLFYRLRICAAATLSFTVQPIPESRLSDSARMQMSAINL
jgi:hypothetical protein